MRLDERTCVQCPSEPPSCTCATPEQCILIEYSCTACQYYACSAPPKQSGDGGISGGAVAGAVIAVVIFLAAVVGGAFWYRRRLRRLRAGAGTESKQDAPARAEDVLNRPDPNEKAEQETPTVRHYTGEQINLDPHASYAHRGERDSTQSNPFGDSHSIQTTSTGTQSNVIPIALVGPQASHDFGMSSTRTSELNHLNISANSLGAESADTGRMANNPNRMSKMTTVTNASYASDFLNEAPVIITGTRSVVKPVAGVKAEYVRAPPSNENLRAAAANVPAGRPPPRSPLAASSFGPSDVLHESDAEREVPRINPFGDEHSTTSHPASPAPSASTFGTPGDQSRNASGPSTPTASSVSSWTPNSPRPAFAKKGGKQRPISTQTAASSIIGADIVSATRVHLGPGGPEQFLEHPPATTSSALLNTPRSQHRMTSAKLVSPQSIASIKRGPMEQQQQRALEDLHPEHRLSQSSVLSTSTRADSILEGFPFVPPSPISNRPLRSPLVQQSFTPAGSPVKAEHKISPPASPLPAPPSRKALGMSVASQSSTMSNGLGSFPFQIDTGNGAGPVDANAAAAASAPPSSFNAPATQSSDGKPQRQRASLDTLALTSELSSYPLGFDRSAVPPVPRR